MTFLINARPSPQFSGSQMDLSLRGSRHSLNSPSLRGLSTSLMDFGQSSKASISAIPEPDKPRLVVVGVARRSLPLFRFDQYFMWVLDQLQPPCMSEQRFCITFFNYPREQDEEVEDVSGPFKTFFHFLPLLFSRCHQSQTMVQMKLMGC